MIETNYNPTTEDKINVCFAFLSYIGETLKQQPGTTQTIYKHIHSAITQTPSLGNGDWEIVWGPAVYTLPFAELQDSGMFVARQISNPANFVVAIRGTNAKALDDWIVEDFDVLDMKPWPGVMGAKISAATHNGTKFLKTKLIPEPSLPGAGQSLSTFLTNICTQVVNISFTGHSLGGALAPTLALYYKQQQGEVDGLDPKNNATITCTAFAGATAGNAEFAAYTNSQFIASPIRRFHDIHDMVPLAWDKSGMEQIKTLYESAGIKTPNDLKFLLDVVILAVQDKHYTQINDSMPLNFPINLKMGDSFTSQAGYQHGTSYVMTILGAGEGSEFLKLVDSFK